MPGHPDVTWSGTSPKSSARSRSSTSRRRTCRTTRWRGGCSRWCRRRRTTSGRTATAVEKAGIDYADGRPPPALDPAADHRADQAGQAQGRGPALVGGDQAARRAGPGGVRVAAAAAVRELGPGAARRRARRRRGEPLPQVGQGHDRVRAARAGARSTSRSTAAPCSATTPGCTPRRCGISAATTRPCGPPGSTRRTSARGGAGPTRTSIRGLKAGQARPAVTSPTRRCARENPALYGAAVRLFGSFTAAREAAGIKLKREDATVIGITRAKPQAAARRLSRGCRVTLRFRLLLCRIPTDPASSAPTPSAGTARSRTPPGQMLTAKWPVLHHGSVPKVDPHDSKWRLRVFGLVDGHTS